MAIVVFFAVMVRLNARQYSRGPPVAVIKLTTSVVVKCSLVTLPHPNNNFDKFIYN